MAAPEEAPEPLHYQTWALRVSLHCEGCKKEVKRVLHHIEGVYKVSFDSQQHKVVVTGNVQADTLIKKLNKSGKHAELWPEPMPAENAAPGGGGKRKGKGKNKNKNKNKSDGRKGDEPPENAENGPGDDGPPEALDKPPDAEAAASADKQSVAEKPVVNASGGGGGGGGGGGKRKGKKGHKDLSNNNVNNNVGGGVVLNGGGSPGAGEVPPQEACKKAAASVMGGGPPGLPPPAMGFPAQLPTYVVSYSSVQPSMSHGGAYHHQHHPMTTQHSSYVYSTASPGSYYIFSEENANACSVM